MPAGAHSRFCSLWPSQCALLLVTHSKRAWFCSCPSESDIPVPGCIQEPLEWPGQAGIGCTCLFLETLSEGASPPAFLCSRPWRLFVGLHERAPKTATGAPCPIREGVARWAGSQEDLGHRWSLGWSKVGTPRRRGCLGAAGIGLGWAGA